MAEPLLAGSVASLGGMAAGALVSFLAGILSQKLNNKLNERETIVQTIEDRLQASTELLNELKNIQQAHPELSELASLNTIEEQLLQYGISS